MGSKKEFNWVLKLKGTLEGLVEGDVRSFEKTEERVYPIGMPIMLADGNWNVLAAVSISEITNSENKTVGTYCVVKVFDEQEREMLTRLHKEFYS